MIGFRSGSNYIAADLAKWLDGQNIKAGRLKGCLLPRDVVDINGYKVATMPAIYQI